MSGLEKFRSWSKVSRWRYALFFASWMAIWAAAIDAARHPDTANLRELANTAILWFVVCYPVSLFVSSPLRSKKPS